MYETDYHLLWLSPDRRWSLTSRTEIYEEGSKAGELDSIASRAPFGKMSLTKQSHLRSDGFTFLCRDDGVWLRVILNRRFLIVENLTTGHSCCAPDIGLLDENASALQCERVSVDGKYMIGTTPSCCKYGDAEVYEIATLQVVRRFTNFGQFDGINPDGIFISPDYRHVLTYADDRYQLTDLRGEIVYQEGELGRDDEGACSGIFDLWWSDNRCLFWAECDEGNLIRWFLLDFSGSATVIESREERLMRVELLTDTHVFYLDDQSQRRALPLNAATTALTIGTGQVVKTYPNSHTRNLVLMPYFPGAEDDMAGWLDFMSK